MKTVVVLSDTHGNAGGIERLDGIFSESDFIIHLGDTSGDGTRIAKKYPDKTFLLNGNCDAMRCGESELVIEIEDIRIFATHGHLYSAKSTLVKLAKRAKELKCKLALYGHTHRAGEDEIDGITLINPGTMSRYSRQSYCYLVINKDKAVAKTVFLENR